MASFEAPAAFSLLRSSTSEQLGDRSSFRPSLHVEETMANPGLSRGRSTDEMGWRGRHVMPRGRSFLDINLTRGTPERHTNPPLSCSPRSSLNWPRGKLFASATGSSKLSASSRQEVLSRSGLQILPRGGLTHNPPTGREARTLLARLLSDIWSPVADHRGWSSSFNRGCRAGLLCPSKSPAANHRKRSPSSCNSVCRAAFPRERSSEGAREGRGGNVNGAIFSSYRKRKDRAKTGCRHISLSHWSVSEDHHPMDFGQNHEDGPPFDYLAGHTECLLQAFVWHSYKGVDGKAWYEVLDNAVDAVANAGFTHVLLPPCSQARDPQGFMPNRFYNLDSAYGTESQLRNVVSRFNERGVLVCADISIRYLSFDVSNQMAWEKPEGLVNKSDKAHEWGKVAGDQTWDVRGRNGRNGWPQTQMKGQKLAAAAQFPMNEVQKWLLWLKTDIGFNGWSFDQAKELSPAIARMYCEETAPWFVAGDYWSPMSYTGIAMEYNQDSHRDDMCHWIEASGRHCSVFDYTTKGILQQSVEYCEYWRLIDPQGRPPGLIGRLPGKAITFIDNHSTGSVPQLWPFPESRLILGYVYILTHPGTPSIFWEHFKDTYLKDDVVHLLAIRGRNHIHSESEITILACHRDLYVARIGAHANDQERFRGVYVKLGPALDMCGTCPGAGWEVSISGQDYAVWENQSLFGVTYRS